MEFFVSTIYQDSNRFYLSIDYCLRYCQHLDWHFRYNRRQKATAKKALSRKWYYDLSDWIQFEEIEDLEERGKYLQFLHAHSETYELC